ncbi:hypothetical protein D3C79_975280 [compost metagenome]
MHLQLLNQLAQSLHGDFIGRVVRLGDQQQRSVEAFAEALGDDVIALACRGIQVGRGAGRNAQLHFRYRNGCCSKPQNNQNNDDPAVFHCEIRPAV